MLKKLGQNETTKQVSMPISEAGFPSPFREGLEYSSPARGTWNIVHTGMLIPESHMIFVCALGCLRGVVLTAAEMNALDRYSAIQVREENVLDGGMEELMIEGVTDVIGKLTVRPKAIEIFISCQHFFMGYDQKIVYKTLRERFPDIHFVDCYMIPTLRKSGVTPDQKMRIQLYAMWEKRQVNPGKVNIIGSNLQISPSCELVRMVEDAGCELWDLYRCRTFDDYMAMAEAGLNLVCEPVAIKAAEDIKRRLGTEYLYLSFTYDFGELEEDYGKLARALGIEKPDFSGEKEAALAAIARAREVIGDTPIAVDYTFTFRILSFVRMLLENG
ncbi:MAG: nitrogenase component 1, partial [Clostridiales bacterium]|nr:nitrogenase component 1 [Clostridiales bacterium]